MIPCVELSRRSPAANLVEQRRVIDEWRRDYNEERPHEALADVPPAIVYRRSPRRYPRKLLKPEPPSWREACDVEEGQERLERARSRRS